MLNSALSNIAHRLLRHPYCQNHRSSLLGAQKCKNITHQYQMLTAWQMRDNSMLVVWLRGVNAMIWVYTAQCHRGIALNFCILWSKQLPSVQLILEKCLLYLEIMMASFCKCYLALLSCPSCQQQHMDNWTPVLTSSFCLGSIQEAKWWTLFLKVSS